MHNHLEESYGGYANPLKVVRVFFPWPFIVQGPGEAKVSFA